MKEGDRGYADGPCHQQVIGCVVHLQGFNRCWLVSPLSWSTFQEGPSLSNRMSSPQRFAPLSPRPLSPLPPSSSSTAWPGKASPSSTALPSAAAFGCSPNSQATRALPASRLGARTTATASCRCRRCPRRGRGCWLRTTGGTRMGWCCRLPWMGCCSTTSEGWGPGRLFHLDYMVHGSVRLVLLLTACR